MKTVLIDGNNSLWRLASKMPILTTSEGVQVQLVYGFFRLLHGVLKDFEPDNVLVLWDTGVPKLRIGIYDGYKKFRRERRAKQTGDDKKLFESVMTQMEMIRDVLPHLSICQYSVMDTEADDLISIACQCLPGKKVIVSGDKDMLQLVSKEVKVYLPLGKTRELYTYKNFEEKVGLTPRQFVEVKALFGDGTDGVPAIAKGIGEGTARTLVKKYGKGWLIWANEDEVRKMGKRFALALSHDAVEAYFRNLKLVDLSLIWSEHAALRLNKLIKRNPKMDELKVRAYFRDNEFQSLLKDFHSWIVPFKQLGAKQ